jgi:transcriptional regulator with XRE-family HTH domain
MFSLDFYKKRISHFLNGFIQRQDSSYRQLGKQLKLSPTSVYRAANEKKEISLSDIHSFASQLNISLATFFSYLEEEKRSEIGYHYPWERDLVDFLCGLSPELRASFVETLMQLQRTRNGEELQSYLKVMLQIADLSFNELELFNSLLGTLGKKK